MITREQYLNALELIDKYHQQLNLSDVRDIPSSNKTKIESWFKSLSVLHKKPSVRLINVLLNNPHYDDGKPFKYVEDVNKDKLLKLRHAGKRTVAEFEYLRKLEKDYAITNE